MDFLDWKDFGLYEYVVVFGVSRAWSDCFYQTFPSVPHEYAAALMSTMRYTKSTVLLGRQHHCWACRYNGRQAVPSNQETHQQEQYVFPINVAVILNIDVLRRTRQGDCLLIGS